MSLFRLSRELDTDQRLLAWVVSNATNVHSDIKERLTLYHQMTCSRSFGSYKLGNGKLITHVNIVIIARAML